MKRINIAKTILLLTMTFFISLTNISIAQTTTDPVDNKSSLRFYLVRHGQTYSNIKEATIGGGGNAQLTPKGRRDAYALGMGFKDAGIKFDAVYSSKLQRAYETASEILAGQSSPLKINQIDGIQDISWGMVEGGRIADLQAQYGVDGNDFHHYFGNFFDKEYKTPVPGTESTYQFSTRFEQALRELVNQHLGKEQNILITAHSTIGFYLSQFDKGIPKGTPNTSASIIEYKAGKFNLIDYGNTQYLEHGHKLYNDLTPLEIVLITSPETIFKNAKVLEGTSDSNLSEKGIKSAKALQEKLKSQDITAIFSSDLNRSRQTYHMAFNNLPDSIIEDARLNELFLGYWESAKYSELDKNDKANFDLLFSDNDISKLPAIDGDGEKVEHSIYRISEMLKEVAYTYQSSKGKVLVFTHPFIVKAYLNVISPNQKIIDDSVMQMITLNYKDGVFSVKNIEKMN